MLVDVTTPTAPTGLVTSEETAPAEPVGVSLTPDAIARIGFKTALVRQAPGGESLAVPATIMSLPKTFTPTSQRMPVVSILMRLMMGCVQMLATPGRGPPRRARR